MGKLVTANCKTKTILFYLDLLQVAIHCHSSSEVLVC